MTDWQPIETAPRDGSYCLLSNEHGTWVGVYVERFTSGYRPEQPWLSMMLNTRHMPRYCSLTPTHWAPLPPPPAQEGEG